MINKYIICLFLAIVVFIAGVYVGDTIKGRVLRNSFVQTECARYNPLTAEFEIIKGIK